MPELEERVHRPVKTFDIVDQRPEVWTCERVLFIAGLEFILR